ncbi:hypothetical protein BSKO_10914 [Bryopsis sp. KO-2023]|nr:hypothetical protein BSKO_10914 [Bryopsis sp. KO-2023]
MESSEPDAQNNVSVTLFDSPESDSDSDGTDDSVEVWETSEAGVPRTLGLWFMSQRLRDSSRWRLKDLPELPESVDPLCGELACACALATTDAGIKKEIASLRRGFPCGGSDGEGLTERAIGMSDCGKGADSAGGGDVTGPVAGSAGLGEGSCGVSHPGPGPSEGVEKGNRPELANVPAVDLWGMGASRAKACLTRKFGRFLKQGSIGLCRNEADDKEEPPNSQPAKQRSHKWGNTHDLLQARELGLCRRGGFSPSQKCHLLCDRRLPNKPVERIDEVNSRAYMGQFYGDGSVFVAAFQDKRIRVYDVDRNWKLKKDVVARNLRWTITDTAFSPDGRFLLYSSITPIVHLVNIDSNPDEIESLANVTDVHDALYFGRWDDQSRSAPHSLGIWSIKWSQDGREIIAGTSDNDCDVCVYDVEMRKTVSAIQGHQDDVNAVAFLDESGQIIASGSDDTLVKVWDRRVMDPRGHAAGVLVGHTEGITHIDAKGDGCHLISNSKDQTIKLWDIRKMVSEGELCAMGQPRLPHFHWDYRWNDYPGAGKDIRHPNDVSLMTYRGHSVLQTLIRAYFSPMHTTGQRYIYTGSHRGKVHVFDLISAEQVEVLDFHRSVVRDCSWHPYDMTLASVSWDGNIIRWSPDDGPGGPVLNRTPFGDRLDY